MTEQPATTPDLTGENLAAAVAEANRLTSDLEARLAASAEVFGALGAYRFTAVAQNARANVALFSVSLDRLFSHARDERKARGFSN